MISLLPDAHAQVRAAVRAVVDHAHAVETATDLDAMKRQLSEVWHAVHQAHQTITEAEQRTRAAALAHIEGQAA